MTYRTPKETVHPLLWFAVIAMIFLIGIIAGLIWSVWPS